jgi:hypothetical protein
MFFSFLLVARTTIGNNTSSFQQHHQYQEATTLAPFSNNGQKGVIPQTFFSLPLATTTPTSKETQELKA